MRLIDADLLREDILNGNTFDTDTVNYSLAMVDGMETAYDVDKVVEKLEVVRENRQYDAERSLHNGNEFMEYGYNCEISGIDNAIHFIKGGGKDANG